jgi:CDP-diacylglycerol---glycerol-3-phosphate 3-phosphatidyltransferase
MTLSDWITLIRLPLALFFFWPSSIYRMLILGIALLTDYLDGLLARKRGNPSRIGRILDPVADKWFVLFVTGIFLAEGALSWWEAAALFARDWALILFGAYLLAKGQWKGFVWRPIWWGKVFTVGQILLLLLLTWKIQLPSWIYGGYWVVGALALRELLQLAKTSPSKA